VKIARINKENGQLLFQEFLFFNIPILHVHLPSVGCELYRLEGIRCETGTVPAAVSPLIDCYPRHCSLKNLREGCNRRISQKTCQFL